MGWVPLDAQGAPTGVEHDLLGVPGPPVVALGGAVLMVGVDAVARSALAPSEIPVGLLTALLGGPFFLFLLLRGAR